MIKSKYSVLIYWAMIIAMLGLFFTNDFGLVDIHKTSVVVAVGIDTEGEEVILTAQVAVPQPSQSGDNIQYTEVQGRGLTIADCLNEINSKTGFYPKLLSCKLILLGEECKSEELFRARLFLQKKLFRADRSGRNVQGQGFRYAFNARDNQPRKLYGDAEGAFRRT